MPDHRAPEVAVNNNNGVWIKESKATCFKDKWLCVVLTFGGICQRVSAKLTNHTTRH